LGKRFKAYPCTPSGQPITDIITWSTSDASKVTVSVIDAHSANVISDITDDNIPASLTKTNADNHYIVTIAGVSAGIATITATSSGLIASTIAVTVEPADTIKIAICD